MQRTAIITGLAAALAAGAAVYIWTGLQRQAFELSPDDARFIAEGRVLYTTHCASCHGANLEGQPDWQTPLENGRMPAPPHNEDGHTWHHSERILFEIMKEGVQKFAGADYPTDMPAYEGVLTDREINAVLSYIKSTWPEQIRTRHDAMSAADRGD